jgi:P2 family phage contractile tail tube protein
MSRTFYGDFSVFKGGQGQFGTAEEVTPPELKWKSEDFTGGGGLGTRSIGLLLDKLELGIKLNSYEDDLYADVLPAPGSSATWKVLGSLIVPGQDEQALKITVTGAVMEFKRDAFKAGGKTTAELKIMDIIYYEEVKNGVQMFEIDLLNQVLRVNGQDRMAVRRRNLGR